MSNTDTVLAAAQRFQQSSTPYALVSVIRAQPPASARPGDKAVVTAEGTIHGWIGGGCAQPAVLKTVKQVLSDGHAQLIRISPTESGEVRNLGDVLEFGMACHSGGVLELFVDPILPAAQLLVIGSSPVAQALSKLAPHVGFEVTVVAHEADAGAFPQARRVIASDCAHKVPPQIAPGAWVVVASQGRRDVQSLRLALAVHARQVSFVASARKAGVLKESLLAAGADAEAVASIIAPAGYPLAAGTPEEIALSVLAAVVAQRRGSVVPGESSQALLLEPKAAPAGVAPVAAASSCCGG